MTLSAKSSLILGENRLVFAERVAFIEGAIKKSFSTIKATSFQMLIPSLTHIT